ncbi:MAG TPA: sulfite exporter TauE/SafE family protein [Candidatus Krumholzibacteria bacterium]|nr:sulfite exporter TauE/SafE family protein [Candidatus Krumholzibacteria bacterium]HPD70847.1 sulfite exporter TauE/SafE family protein [Candidatus Krumholzibacteria bacterium]HRY39453.1 sulfite exporter TauE/SafE family protein [Candidatus Krumholzibacteria bacterium]
MPELIFSGWWQFAATCAILAAAQLVYVVVGFGSGLIAVGSLALIFPEVRDVVVLLLLVNLPAEVGVAVSARREIRWRSASGLLLGIAPGVVAGAWFLRVASPTLVLAALGAFLVVISLVFLRLPAGAQVHWPRWVTPPTGLAAGLLTGLFGAGGPPLIIYYHLSDLPKSAFRGNLMALFLVMTLWRTVNYAAQGLLTAPRLWSSLALLPAAVGGAWLGQRIHVCLPEPVFRRLVAGLLGVFGVLLLLRDLG